MSPINLTPTEPRTMAKAVQWLEDSAAGIWTAPKFADVYAPLILDQHRRLGAELAEAEARIERLTARNREANKQVTDTCGVRYEIAERAAELVLAHESAPLIGHRRHLLPHIIALSDALQAGR